MTAAERWKEVALEYRKEIEALWDDIDKACVEFDKNMPRSFKKGVHILEKTLDFSKENVKIVAYGEPIEAERATVQKPPQKTTKSQKVEQQNHENSFKWLRRYQQKKRSSSG